MPGIFNLDHAGNLELRRLKVGFTQTCRLKAWECPIAGPTQSTPLSCQFCATQCNLRCDAACQTRTECGSDERAQHPSGGTQASEAALWLGKTPPPIGVLLGEGFERPQLFGLAASIAARLTICPISLACSASARIWACTYSLCSRITSVRSLACSSFSA